MFLSTPTCRSSIVFCTALLTSCFLQVLSFFPHFAGDFSGGHIYLASPLLHTWRYTHDGLPMFTEEVARTSSHTHLGHPNLIITLQMFSSSLTAGMLTSSNHLWQDPSIAVSYLYVFGHSWNFKLFQLSFLMLDDPWVIFVCIQDNGLISSLINFLILLTHNLFAVRAPSVCGLVWYIVTLSRQTTQSNMTRLFSMRQTKWRLAIWSQTIYCHNSTRLPKDLTYDDSILITKGKDPFLDW